MPIPPRPEPEHIYRTSPTSAAKLEPMSSCPAPAAAHLIGCLSTTPQLASFRALCERTVGHRLGTAQDLHAFSVSEPDLFWRALLDWSELPWSGSADTVLVGDDVETARFFPDLRLNYAE